MAFVIDPERIGFAGVDVAQPIQLFRSLHGARAWLDRNRQALPWRARGYLTGRLLLQRHRPEPYTPVFAGP